MGKKPCIQLIIQSKCGACAAGFAIIDVMEWSRVPIYTTGLGIVASMGLLVFMTGAPGHRILTPRTSILSHRFWSMGIGNHSQLIALRKQQDLEHRRIIEHYARHTKLQDAAELERTLLRDVDTWLSPEEAVAYGIADGIEASPERVLTVGAGPLDAGIRRMHVDGMEPLALLSDGRVIVPRADRKESDASAD